jgi:hypothetical protein
MERELRPNWDAANPESYKLAKRLGFTFIETYDSYYHTREYNLGGMMIREPVSLEMSFESGADETCQV